MRIKIDGTIYVIEKVYQYGYLPLAETESGEEFYLVESSEAAGKAARRYWEDMAQNDPGMLVEMIGKETLVNWALGISDGPGSTAVSSLEEWFGLWEDAPAEQWASYDSEEREVNAAGRLITEELGFEPTVAYRHN